ncbi:MAG: Sulfite reductase [NADPH] flavoprotein alpha-component [Candidatus Erwinia impunctatus]|nr:Sulfite reductase [NADPH] flavoprotein alpha-component [Culicoides impunctatus]
MSKQPHIDPLLPITAEQRTRLQTATGDFSPTQLAWLSGYFWGRVNPSSSPETAALTPPAAQSITLLSASQTGNARRIAEQLRDDLLAQQCNVKLVNAGGYKFKQIAQETLLVIVTSTQGEGEPPEEAVALHKYLMSKKAPKLDNTAFAVLALGDSSYNLFCQAGKDFDQRLAELGGERLLSRVDADVDYHDTALGWRKTLAELLAARAPGSTIESAVATGHSTPALTALYSKETPLVATLLTNQKITGRDSTKDVRHIEIDLADSGMHYQPGDALGVWYENDPLLVDEILQLLWLQGDEQVSWHGQPVALRELLQKNVELTVNTAQIVQQYAALARDNELLALVSDREALQQYAQRVPLVEMIRQAPVQLTAEQFVPLLRPLTPRLYSIASSLAETDNEVHITVGVVRYQIDGREHTGGASGYLADRCDEDAEVRVFIEHNDNFRLPENPATPVIMIGPGTGIAPFRAFIQQREAEGAEGKNWLFFGNPHFTDDFLYQVEWQRYVKEGVLTNIDLAWSRDQQDKVYVQDKIRQQGAEIWQWLTEGAHLYVCGDASRMAKDVEKALLEVVAEQGGMDSEAADEFLSELRIERRYQRDVY